MKQDRLFSITNLLMQKDKLTAKELASRFEVSERTIYRDIETLSMNGVPIYTEQGKNGGIFLLEGYTIEKSSFSKEEQLAILTALQSVQATKQVHMQDTLTKLGGLFQRKPENWIEIDYTGWEQGEEEKKQFELLRDQIYERKCVSFFYVNNKGEEQMRKVEPLKLIFKGFQWYLYGFCLLRKDYRIFKLSRISKLEPIDRVSKTPIPEAIKQNYQSMYQTEKMTTIHLKVKKSSAFRVFDEFRDGTITSTKDGYDIVVKRPLNSWLIGYFMGFGRDLTILEPKQLQEEYKKELKEILNNYKT